MCLYLHFTLGVFALKSTKCNETRHRRGEMTKYSGVNEIRSEGIRMQGAVELKRRHARHVTKSELSMW